MIFRTALIAALAGSLTGAACASAILPGFTGKWTGRGELRTGPASEPARGICQLEVGADDATAGLRIRGKCASAAGSGTLDVAVEDCGGDCVAARGTVSRWPEPIAFRGMRRGGGFEVRSTGLIDADGGVWAVELSVRPNEDGGFDLIEHFENAGSGERIEMVRMRFSSPDGGT